MKSKLLMAYVFVLSLLTVSNAKAQYLPVVYNNTYERMSSITQIMQFPNTGDVVAVGQTRNAAMSIWLDRDGVVRFSKEFAPSDFAQINRVISLDSGKILLVGNSKKVGKKDEAYPAGRAIILHADGSVERKFEIGDEYTNITGGKVLSNHDYLFWGSKQGIGYDSKSLGYICRYSPDGKRVYEFTCATGQECMWVKENEGSSSVIAVFNNFKKGGQGASVVSLSKSGVTQFITELTDKSFIIDQCVFVDGNIYLAGVGNQFGGAVVKIRPEGDVVFVKNILDASLGNALVEHVLLSPSGDLLVGACAGNQTNLHVLRNDGTIVNKVVFNGRLTAMGVSEISKSIVLTLYNDDINQGLLVKLDADAKKLFEKNVNSRYSEVKISSDDDILLASATDGRVSMFTSFGELMFDRYVDEQRIVNYKLASMGESGEIIFSDGADNITKLAHGIYIDDVSVVKPANGMTTAMFSVTLSGYSFSEEGAPLPVTVKYKTKELSASSKDNFKMVEGELSFIPSAQGKSQYLAKEVIEVPILANGFIEGTKNFDVELTDVSNSYIIKNRGVGTIEDQQAIVKHVGVTNGVEGQKGISFELGLFKLNGEKLINRSGADVVIEGKVGEGTADSFDYDISKLPRLNIESNNHSGVFVMPTIEDTRYENEKTLYINFDQVSTMSGTRVSLPSSALICEGKIIDQAAYVSIVSLGNQSQSNNSVSSFAKIELRRAKDGAIQTNNSGADIRVGIEIDSASSAQKGLDFVFVNAHDLKIVGDGKYVSTNLNGIVLYNNESMNDKEVVINLVDVNQVQSAGQISIKAQESKCSLIVKQKELVN